MKRLTLIAIVLFTAFTGYGQVTWDEAGIRKSIKDYGVLIGNGKTGEATLNYAHPKLFEKVLEMSGQEMSLEEFKKLMVEQIDKMLNDPTMEMSFKGFKIDNLSELIVENDITYALATTFVSFTMTFKEEENDEESEAEGDEEDEMSAFDFTANMIKMKYGEDNVIVDKENQKLTINTQTQTLAIGDKTLDGWKFMDYKKEQLIMFEILPKEVAEKLAKFE